MPKPTQYFSAGRGDASPFAAFVTRHSQELLLFFVRRTYDVETSRDLTAETFAQAWEHRRRFRGSSAEEATGWLYGIARHQFSRYARRGQVHRKAVERLGIQVPPISDDDYDRVLELAGLRDLRRGVKAAMELLPPDQQEMLRLRIVEEQEYGDMAAALGLSEQAVRARVSRALAALATKFDMQQTREAMS